MTQQIDIVVCRAGLNQIDLWLRIRTEKQNFLFLAARYTILSFLTCDITPFPSPRQNINHISPNQTTKHPHKCYLVYLRLMLSFYIKYYIYVLIKIFINSDKLKVNSNQFKWDHFNSGITWMFVLNITSLLGEARHKMFIKHTETRHCETSVYLRFERIQLF